MSRRALSGVSARGPMFRIRAVQETARGVSIPAPVGGLDALSPLAAMPEQNAVTLTNMFPQPGYVEIRGGHKTHAVCGAAAVESLMPYHGLTAASDALYAACTADVFNVTASATTTASVALTGMSNARWQHVNFSTTGGNHLWICNGADKPRFFDGSTWATASVTGITATDIVNVTVFKNRLWLALNGAISPEYLNTDSVQGTATTFDLTGVFQEGGYLQAIGSWSIDSGAGPDDLICFVSSRGEVAIYSGTNPASDFLLKGVFHMGAPIGRRCLTKVGSDLAVISVDGVLPLSRALMVDRAAALLQAVTRNIQPLVNSDARNYAANFGWQLISYPRGTRAILNVPTTENSVQKQYVMNTITGAWCDFAGENANCWAVYQDRLFYGGNAGIVKESDCQGFDDDGTIDYDMITAFNYLKSRGRLKQVTMIQPLFTTDGQVTPGIGVGVDFDVNITVGPTSFTQSQGELWDVAVWDVDAWPLESRIVNNWYSVAGEGYSIAARIMGSIQADSTAQQSDSLTFQVNGFNLLNLEGAFI